MSLHTQQLTHTHRLFKFEAAPKFGNGNESSNTPENSEVIPSFNEAKAKIKALKDEFKARMGDKLDPDFVRNGMNVENQKLLVSEIIALNRQIRKIDPSITQDIFRGPLRAANKGIMFDEGMEEYNQRDKSPHPHDRDRDSDGKVYTGNSEVYIGDADLYY